MFDLVHQLRTRIIKSPAFNGDKVIGAILFERTMDGEIDGKPTANFLWEDCNVVPFLKVDKGLADEADGVQVMKPMPGLDELLEKGVSKGVFGTKMRSVVNSAYKRGIGEVVAQQFAGGHQILRHGLVPIIEPEGNINAPDKAEAEAILADKLMAHVETLGAGQDVMLKLTLPDVPGLYDALADHPRVLRVVALSGGYSTSDASARLAKNHKMIASFSRALTEGLQRDMADADFEAALGQNISTIHAASIA